MKLQNKIVPREGSGMALKEELCSRVLSLKGRVKILVEEGGVSRVHFDDKNLIVNGAKPVMAHLLGAAPSNYVLSKLQLGTEGNVDGDIMTPLTPDVADFELHDASPITVNIASVEYLPVGVESSVLFRFILAKADGNGSGIKVYTEAGLFTTSDIMFAVENFPALVKNADRKITIEWTIAF